MWTVSIVGLKLTIRTVLTVWMWTVLTMWPQLTAPLVLVLVLWLDTVAGYCAGLGANPGFRGPPKVEQVSQHHPGFKNHS